MFVMVDVEWKFYLHKQAIIEILSNRDWVVSISNFQAQILH